MALSEQSYDAISSYGRVLSKALDERDMDTRRHCGRVIELAGALGRCCRLDREDLRHLRVASALHDIGKIGIPDRVLHKPGCLDREEWKEMRTHSERGERIVLAIGVEGAEEVARLVRHHHEHYDGSGYPDGLAGEEIPFVARMVSVVDGYDAMASPRPYHKVRGHEQIMAVLADEAGSKYDPHILARFAEMIGESSGKAPTY